MINLILFFLILFLVVLILFIDKKVFDSDSKVLKGGKHKTK